MPRNPETTRPLHVVLPVEGYNTLKSIADQQRRPLADVVREALENYMRELGFDISLAVERGGDRTSRE